MQMGSNQAAGDISLELAEPESILAQQMDATDEISLLVEPAACERQRLSLHSGEAAA